ncbi:phenylacetate--CoA ligase family protein [Haloflavibacter putidus]|uniref:Phenylacetate--CoA ligase n=1 Tax=Haloflavibacter putidus TaxID=2576776 RepID=A0A507ZUQ3_9FLAO|nr:AMP-binding protein [Haloflavibacter putidus]TQD40203.1 phenylacetate--CoA ligase [Haloflavibacter putidus]
MADKTDLKSEQWQKVLTQLYYLEKNSAFYKKLLQENNIELSKITPTNFSKIPITTKKDLAAQTSDFICVPQTEIIDYVTTSGTLGKPVSFALNENDLQRLAENEAKSFKLVGVKPEDVVQITTTLDRRFIAGMAYFLGLRKLGAGIVRVGSGAPALQWDSIQRFSPSYLVAVPSFLLKMIQFAKENNIDCNKSSVKAAICIGEPLRNNNFELNTLGKKIKELWDIELFSTYASTEMCTAFTECKMHRGNHIPEDLIFTEVVDEEGNSVNNGEAGELTITTLGVETMPLLRYATGDIVTKINKPCNCGVKGNRISTVLGRKQQLIKFKGTSVYPQQIEEVLARFKEIDLYLIRVSTNKLDTDAIEIYIPNTVSVDTQKALKNHLRANLRVLPELVLKEEKVLETMIFKPEERKPIRFIDDRK